MTEHRQDAKWNVSKWHGRTLVDRAGERIGKLQDVVVDVHVENESRNSPPSRRASSAAT